MIAAIYARKSTDRAPAETRVAGGTSSRRCAPRRTIRCGCRTWRSIAR